MDLLAFEQDNTINCKLESAVPQLAKKEPCLLGIDEAGRGPVLGPMVYAATYCPISFASKLKDLGFADSKTLTEEKRESLFTTINKTSDSIGWLLEVLSPSMISNCMLRRCKYNLNALSHDTAISLIQRALDLEINLSEVYVDTVGVAEKYQAKLCSIFPEIKITVAKKADSTFPIVSAASICAKVARDNSLKGWKFSEGVDFIDKEYGSGYPNDPVTKKFISENIDSVFGFPQLVRFSWSTASKILENKTVEVTWDEDDDDNQISDGKTQQLISFFRDNKSPKLKKPKNHNFFTQRNLHQTVNL